MNVGEICRMKSSGSKDTVALLISVICVVGVLHLEWKSINCNCGSKLLVQRKDEYKSNMEESETNMKDGK